MKTEQKEFEIWPWRLKRNIDQVLKTLLSITEMHLNIICLVGFNGLCTKWKDELVIKNLLTWLITLKLYVYAKRCFWNWKCGIYLFLVFISSFCSNDAEKKISILKINKTIMMHFGKSICLIDIYKQKLIKINFMVNFCINFKIHQGEDFFF